MANTYGSDGNRWWVGLNTGETGGQSTILGKPSKNPFDSTSGYESLPSGDAADDAQFATAARKNALGGTPVTISVENIQWYNIRGPYPTQAKANAAITGIQKAHPAPGAVAQATGNTGLPSSLTSGITGFLGALTSASTWIRVTKVIAGSALLLVGVAKLSGAGGIAAKAVKVAPLL
jgi:hypothetical protein